jgi:hypothetical protein
MNDERPSWRAAFRRVELSEKLAVVAWIAVGVGVQVLGAPLAAFTRFGPGPGFFLKALSAILIILAVLQGMALVQQKRVPAAAGPDETARKPGRALRETGPAATRSGMLRFVLLTVTLLAYVYLLPLLGFVIATSGLSWAALMFLGRHPGRALVEAAIAVILLHYVFTVGLGVPLPQPQLHFLRAFSV